MIDLTNFKPIPGFENYLINKDGEVYSKPTKKIRKINKELFKKFENKIIHIIVNNLPHIHPNIDFSKGEQCNNERFQRNQIPRGFDNIKLDDEDIIIITDVDEIPNKNTLKTIKNGLIKINMNQLEMDLYYCNLNRRRFKTGHLKVSQIKFVGHDSKE